MAVNLLVSARPASAPANTSDAPSPRRRATATAATCNTTGSRSPPIVVPACRTVSVAITDAHSAAVMGHGQETCRSTAAQSTSRVTKRTAARSFPPIRGSPTRAEASALARMARGIQRVPA